MNNDARRLNYVKDQQGYTCWYYAMMNGFMVSRRCHRVMHFITQKFITENIKTHAEFQKFQNPTECQRGQTLYSFCQQIFLHDTFEKSGIQSIFTNINNKSVNKGYAPLAQLSKFMKVSGIDPHINWVDETDGSFVEAKQQRIFTIVYNCEEAPINTNIQMDNTSNKDSLEFASFGVGGKHSITGVRVGQKYWVIDSNGFKGEIDWRNPLNILKDSKYKNWSKGEYSSIEIDFVVYASAACDSIPYVKDYKFEFQNKVTRKPIIRVKRPTKNNRPK